MSVQTTYSVDYTARQPGQESGTTRVKKLSGVNQLAASAEAVPGLAYKQHSSIDLGFVALAAATDRIKGIVLNDYARDPNGLAGTNGAYANGVAAPMATEGPLYVRIDQDVTPSDPVYVRFAASATGATGAIGSFRKDRDGVAQVTTITPTAVNSQISVLRVKFADESYTFEYQADGSATATEIVTGFKTAMAADSAFTARVVASGTTTLILTGQVAGEAFTATSEGDGALAVVATTPPAPTARLVHGAVWRSTGTAAAGVGELDFNVLADF